MLSECLFGRCQCFWCSYFIRCIVPQFSSITPKTLFCFCWYSNFCEVSSSKTSCCNGIFLSFSSLHFFGYCGSLEAFHISVNLVCAAIWLTDSIFWLSKRVVVLFLSNTRAPSRILRILFWDLCAIVMYRLFGCSSVSQCITRHLFGVKEPESLNFFNHGLNWDLNVETEIELGIDRHEILKFFENQVSISAPSLTWKFEIVTNSTFLNLTTEIWLFSKVAGFVHKSLRINMNWIFWDFDFSETNPRDESLRIRICKSGFVNPPAWICMDSGFANPDF